MRLPVHSLVAVLGMGMGALAQEPPRGPDITYITWSGSGCPSASVATQVGTVQKGGTVLFSSIEADLDPKVPGDEESTDCSVAVSISSIPAGYQVVFQSLIWRGYMLLREGATGTHTISSTWLNNPCETFSQTGTESGGEYDLVLTPNFNDADQAKYGSACTPAGGAEASTVATFGLNVTLQRSDPSVTALTQFDSLDFVVALKAC